MRAFALASLLAAVVCSASPTQHPLSTPPSTQSLALVDLLSQSPDHSELLQLFRKARLIPMLNRINGTIFAPTNQAIKRVRERDSSSIWSVSDTDLTTTPANDYNSDDGLTWKPTQPHDNLQLALRDSLLQHCLNYTLIPAPGSHINSTNTKNLTTQPPLLPINKVTLQETLYFPNDDPFTGRPKRPELPGSPGDNTDPDAPHGKEGLLRGEGQKVRVIRKASKGVKGSDVDASQVWVGGDWKGEGGIKVVAAPVWAKNGVLLSVDDVLEKPKTLASIIRATPSLSTFASLLTDELLDNLTNQSHLTVFAPTNDAWGTLSELEQRYLRSGFAQRDLIEIFQDSSSTKGTGKGRVGYIAKLLDGDADAVADLVTLANTTLELASTDRGPAVNGSKIEVGDILAENGVLHTVPSLLLPSGSLSITAEKYLIALNATRFVALLRSVNLSHLAQVPAEGSGSDEAYTILAPRDDVLLNHMTLPRLGRLPEEGSPALKEVLAYHVLPGRWAPEDLEDGMLVGTELRPDELKGSRQHLEVSMHVADSETRTGKGWDEDAIKAMRSDKSTKSGTVASFGGSSVVGEPIAVGNSLIYLLSSVIEPPSNVITTAVSDLRLSTFVAAVYAAGLDHTLNSQPAVTYLVPSNLAFADLGLVMSYLLLPMAKHELRFLIEYHAIDGEVLYLDRFPVGGGSKRFPTLAGSEIYLEHDKANETLTVHGPTIGGVAANGEARDAVVLEGDILTATGVLHVIDQVVLPPTLEVDPRKLLLGAKATTMVDLIKAANMSWVLDGKRAPSDFLAGGKNRARRTPKADRAYTILCPTDKALARLNLTYYMSDPTALSDLVRLHILPTHAFSPLADDGRPLRLSDQSTFASLLDESEGGRSQYGHLAFKESTAGDWIVGIKSARGTNGENDSARVVSYGRATPWVEEVEDGGVRVANGGGVMVIDSVLLPYEPGWFRRNWVWLALGGGAVVLAGLIGWGGWKLWQRRHREDYEVLSNAED